MDEPIWKSLATPAQIEYSTLCVKAIITVIKTKGFDEFNNPQFMHRISTEPYLMKLIREDRLNLYKYFRAYRIKQGFATE